VTVVIEPSVLVVAAVLVIVVEDDELADEALLLLSPPPAPLVFSAEAGCGVTDAAALPMELIDMSLLPLLLTYLENDGHPSTVAPSSK
jgi:hypothetical protein